MNELKGAIAEANRRAGLDRQRAFGKKQVVRQTADQVIDNLCERAGEVLEAFYKNRGEAALREAMRNLQGAVAVAGKRVRG